MNSKAKYKWTVMKLDGLLAFQGIPKKMVMSDSSLKYTFAIAKRRRLKFSKLMAKSGWSLRLPFSTL